MKEPDGRTAIGAGFVHRSLLTLLAASTLGLFFEKIAVRRLSAEVRLCSHFNNVA